MATPMQSYTNQFKNNEPLPEFEYQKKLQNQKIEKDASIQRDSLERRLAQLQGGPSGAGVKLGMQLEDEIAIKKDEANTNLFSQELAVRRQMDETQKQREFQTSERMGGQQFAGEQAGLQRGFQTGERLGSQQFAGGQADTQRDFLKRQADQELAFKEKVYAFDSSMKGQEFKLAQDQFEEDKKSTEYNKISAFMNNGDYKKMVFGLYGLFTDPSTSQAGKGAIRNFLVGTGYGDPLTDAGYKS